MDKNAILVDAKNEYTKQFINVLYLPVFKKIESLYNIQNDSIKNKNDVLKNFQSSLQEIQFWNKLQIDEVTTQILDDCEWFTDLLAAIFITNVKILSSIKMKKGRKNINITMPKCEDFIHKLYINVAESLYYNPDYFSIKKNGRDPVKKTKPEIIFLIKDAIELTISDLLPFQNILQNYLGQNLEESDSEDEEEDDPEQEDEQEDDPEPEDEQEDDPEPEGDPEPEDEQEYEPEPEATEPFSSETNVPFAQPQPQPQPQFAQPQAQAQTQKPSFFQPNEAETKTVSITPHDSISTQQKQPIFFNDASD